MLCVLMEALGIDIGKMTEQAHARAPESGAPEQDQPAIGDGLRVERLALGVKTGAPHAQRSAPNAKLPSPCMESSS
jgi:hypothetical protein